MRRVLALSLSVLALLLTAGVGAASGDPIKSPNVSFGTLQCGDVTYTVVSPNHAPVGQMVTANGDNSTSVQIMILDKASAFPQDKLTHCMFTGPEFFEVDLLITPVG